MKKLSKKGIQKLIITIMIIVIISTTYPINTISISESQNIEMHNKEILGKVEIIQNFAEEYIEKNNITNNSVTNLCMQYIRKDRYNSSLWNILLGEIDTNFITYLASKENVPTFKSEVLFDNNTSKKIDFVHMIAALNAYIKNGEKVMLMVSTDYAGWAGDLITLLEEVTVHRIENNIEDKNTLQEYSNSLLGTNNLSTCDSSDILADLDAIALYKDNNNKIGENLYNALYKYYVSTDSKYNASNRLASAQTILGGTKENVKERAKDLLTNTDFTIIDIKESFFNNSDIASKVTSTDIDVVSQSFANYVYGEPYLKLQQNAGSGIVGETTIDVKIIESNANVQNNNIEIEKTEIASAEINGEYLRITPLKAGTTNITVYSKDKTVSSTYKLTAKCNHAYTIIKDETHHWEQCSLCEEIKANTMQEHSGATHENGGKCIVKECNYTYDYHGPVISSITYEKIDNNSHKTVYKCSVSECEKTFEETNNHEGAEHSNGGICLKCKYQYDPHIISKEIYDWDKKETTHNPIYKCTNASCQETEKGISEQHSGATHPDGECKKCGYKYEEHGKSEIVAKYDEKTAETHTPVYACKISGCHSTYKGEPKEHIVAGWTDNEEGTHRGECTECKQVVIKKHIYESGKCKQCEAQQPIQECVHDYKVKSNENQHWEECSKCKKIKEDATEKHTNKYTDKYNGIHDIICIECNYTITQNCTYKDGHCIYCNSEDKNFKPVECSHTYETEKNNTEHWQECSKCGKIKSETAEKHIYEYNDNKNKTHTAICLKCQYEIIQEHNYKNGQCIECKAKQNIIQECTHDSYKIGNNKEQHWEECKQCGKLREGTLQKHTYSSYIDNGNGTHSTSCTICELKIIDIHSYEMGKCINCDDKDPEAECEHNYQIKSNKTTHWRECTKCNQAKKDSTEKHKITSYIDNKDGTHTGICTICKYNLKSEHNYQNKICSNCKVEQEDTDEKCEHKYIIQSDKDSDWAECQKCGEVKVGSLKSHNYTKCVDNGDETHTKICSDCGYKHIQNHKKETCTECGNKKPLDNEKPKDPTVSDKEIPNTGIRNVMPIVIVALTVISMGTALKIKKYKNIK